MTIQTDYYGEVEYDEKDLICFPDGFFGFPDLKNYLPLLLNEDDDSMLLMQSTERSEVAFVVINPFVLDADYSPSLTQEELSCLKVSDGLDLSYFVICVIHENYLENTVNLKCPLVINPQTRIGMQVILGNSCYGHRHMMSSFPILSDSSNTDDRSEEHADSQT